jgi:hypothetical protein
VSDDGVERFTAKKAKGQRGAKSKNLLPLFALLLFLP